MRMDLPWRSPTREGGQLGRVSFAGELPPEVLALVASRLKARGVGRLACCSRRLRLFAQTAAVWEPIFRAAFGAPRPASEVPQRRSASGRPAARKPAAAAASAATWRQRFRLECAAVVRRKVRRAEDRVQLWASHEQELADFASAESVRLMRLQRTSGAARRRSAADLAAAREGAAAAAHKLSALREEAAALRFRFRVLAGTSRPAACEHTLGEKNGAGALGRGRPDDQREDEGENGVRQILIQDFVDL